MPPRPRCAFRREPLCSEFRFIEDVIELLLFVVEQPDAIHLAAAEQIDLCRHDGELPVYRVPGEFRAATPPSIRVPTQTAIRRCGSSEEQDRLRPLAAPYVGLPP